jgi:hypothetical protein
MSSNCAGKANERELKSNMLCVAATTTGEFDEFAPNSSG